ncbi:MAG: hypothetical protein SGJ02_08045 [bacterium]|nr:hypothetical protein [bacterium]
MVWIVEFGEDIDREFDRGMKPLTIDIEVRGRKVSPNMIKDQLKDHGLG